MTVLPFNELDLLLDWIRDQLELHEQQVPTRLALDPGILPVVDVLANRDDFRVVLSRFQVAGAAGNQSFTLLAAEDTVGGPPYAAPPAGVELTRKGETAVVLMVSAERNNIAGLPLQLVWSLFKGGGGGGEIPVRGLSLAQNTAYAAHGSNAVHAAGPVFPIEPTQIDAAMGAVRPWVIPPGLALNVHVAALNAAQLGTISTLMMVFPRGARFAW